MLNINSMPFCFGTMQNYMKNAELKIKFEQRKQNYNLETNSDEKSEKQSQIDQICDDLKNIRQSNKISGIDMKLRSGGELTDDELAYLKQKDPELYKKAIEVKRERKLYRKALNNCRTKEDVEKLKVCKLHEFMSGIKTIKSNPDIPEEKKRELIDQINRRMMGVFKEHTKFVSSENYKNLPTEKEILLGEKRKKGYIIDHEGVEISIVENIIEMRTELLAINFSDYIKEYPQYRKKSSAIDIKV